MEKLIHLILVCVLVSIPDSLEENLARRGTVIQSSTYYSWIAQNAIDGKRYGPGSAASCSITGYQLSPWWMLDLLDYYEISTVIITARSDCCLDQTNGVEIRIGNSTENNGNNNPICAVTSGFQLGQTISYSCGVMVGRYINLVMTGRTNYVSLCEVEVYKTENVARRGTVTPSLNQYTWIPEKAIDGIKYGSPGSFCFASGNQNTPWWRLDLKYRYEIDTIIITARTDCCPDQTNGAEIRIGNSLENNGNNNPRCAVTSGFSTGYTLSYSCNGMEGRYVNVVMTGRVGYLTLCEVEVYGKCNYKKSILKLKFLSSVDAVASNSKILSQLQSAMSLHISNFNLSWTRPPYKEKVTQPDTGPCVKSSI